MSDYQLGEIVAERVLHVEGRPEIEVRVLMGMPQMINDDVNGPFVCPIQIVGIGDERVKGARGADAFQAIELGMQLIGTELYVKINRNYHGKLRWDGEADLAFPLPDSVREFGPGYYES